MLDALKAAGAIAGLMKNQEALKAAGERIRRRLSELRADGGSGGGAVRAIAGGDMRLIRITLDPAVLSGLASADPRSKELVESLIVEAVNNAMDIAKAAAQREIAKEAEALGLPGLPGLEGLLSR